MNSHFVLLSELEELGPDFPVGIHTHTAYMYYIKARKDIPESQIPF